MRPLDAEILLHYFVSTENHPRMYAPEVGKTHADMSESGLLECGWTGDFSLTNKGVARVRAMLGESGDDAPRKWFVVPDYKPDATPATSATVVDRAGQQVAHFERIADAESAVEAVNGRT